MQTAAESHTLFRLMNDAHSTVGDAVFGMVSGLGDGLIIALICTPLMLFRREIGFVSPYKNRVCVPIYPIYRGRPDDG